jgi:hypothetical protein
MGILPDDPTSTVSGPGCIGDIPEDIGSIWRSIRRASRRADPRHVARAVASYAYGRGVRDPIRLTARAARIAELAASGDRRALSLAMQTARDAARGVPGADVAYKAVRAFDHVYRSRPVQMAVQLADYTPASAVMTAPIRALGAGASATARLGAAVY